MSYGSRGYIFQSWGQCPSALGLVFPNPPLSPTRKREIRAVVNRGLFGYQWKYPPVVADVTDQNNEECTSSRVMRRTHPNQLIKAIKDRNPDPNLDALLCGIISQSSGQYWRAGANTIQPDRLAGKATASPLIDANAMYWETIITELPRGDSSNWSGSVGWLRRALEEWKVLSRMRENGGQETKMRVCGVVSLFYIAS